MDKAEILRTRTTMDELPGTTREDKRATGMFKSAFNNVFRAGLHALAYQHVTALCLQLWR